MLAVVAAGAFCQVNIVTSNWDFVCSRFVSLIIAAAAALRSHFENTCLYILRYVDVRCEVLQPRQQHATTQLFFALGI